MNSRTFASSRGPPVRTPLQTSTPYGRTASIAARTFSALSPPASQSGTLIDSRISLLTVQSWTRPVPPSSLIFADGFPEWRLAGLPVAAGEE